MARDKTEHESRRILGRVGAETEASMPSSGRAGDDWAELWGRRIGRVLSFVLFGFAVYWLYELYMQAG